MSRIKKGIVQSPPSVTRFVDDFDLYVDFGSGRPVKMNDNEATLVDVEKFLIGHSSRINMMNNKKFNGSSINRESMVHKINNYGSTTSSEQSLTRKLVRHSSFRNDGQENTNPSSYRKYQSGYLYNRPSGTRPSSQIDTKIIYDESWPSNKQYNTRVAAFIDRVHEKFANKNGAAPSKVQECKSPRTCIYQVPSGKTVHERIYPAVLPTENKLCLRVAVNGASKSMRGQLPMSNLNLSNGDFGDDAGMIVENRDYCFVGLADGAGGNRSFGINPADFSRAILASCRSILRQTLIQPTQLPRLILSAMQQVEASGVRGSSTFCLLALDKAQHKLTSLNIGDSGFVVYRNNTIYRRSKCTMNSNGCGPRQLFSVNDCLGLPCFLNENEVLRDCSLDTIDVQQGDIIILSSDGLWDVIKIDQLQLIVERNANKRLQDLADDLLSQAVEGYMVNGRDDILVIVCRVDS